MKCPKCEKENIHNSNICEYCGTEMFAATERTQSIDSPDTSPKKKSKKKIVVTIIAIILVIALTVGGVLFVLNEQEKQRQIDAKTGVTISELSDVIDGLSVSETEEGMIYTFEDDENKYTVVADEYGNAREITLECEVDMQPGSQGFERLTMLTSDEILDCYYYGNNGHLTLNKIYVDELIMRGTDVYCLCANLDSSKNKVYLNALDEVVLLQHKENTINDWNMKISFTDDCLTFEAIYTD